MEVSWLLGVSRAYNSTSLYPQLPIFAVIYLEAHMTPFTTIGWGPSCETNAVELDVFTHDRQISRTNGFLEWRSKKMRLPWRFALLNMKFSWKISPTSEEMTFKKKHTHQKLDGFHGFGLKKKTSLILWNRPTELLHLQSHAICPVSALFSTNFPVVILMRVFLARKSHLLSGQLRNPPIKKKQKL